MGGTVDGGRKAAATNKEKYGLDFYPQIGYKGGKVSRGGGFKPGSKAARDAGRKGGTAPRRLKAKAQQQGPVPSHAEASDTE